MDKVLFEVAGERGKVAVYEDSELGHVFAVMPFNGKVNPTILREVREMTLDPWRYVEGIGFLLDLTAWRQESQVDVDDIKNKVEGKYREIIDQIFQYLETAPSKTAEEKKRAKKKRKSRKKTKKAKKGGKKRRQA
ncbi:hypothetical protein [Pyrobaculum ferrireducens]|uniref:Uncharacterized protein n=1 Tax=Pyrobaculum ferrireducens TaxID=1104324 RepID=G7VGX0_9CREN|nr:hypothetical protein [Pyrobaculum ferrireducens]AET31953.1 hypothetical protein P186_0501 [Pyrobaculum ferrireducens]